jgi:hypothetical protein
MNFIKVFILITKNDCPELYGMFTKKEYALDFAKNLGLENELNIIERSAVYNSDTEQLFLLDDRPIFSNPFTIESKDVGDEMNKLVDREVFDKKAIQYKDELLQQIAAGVNEHRNVQASCLEVVFKVDDNEYSFDLPTVLDCLANDLYWDERGNWSEARIAEVRTI